MFAKKSQMNQVMLHEGISPISINDRNIQFTSSAEHVRVIRSTDVLPAGLARNHSANPAASLRFESLYALLVLLSGVAPLNLKNSEIKCYLLPP